jgi:hypothetical protein
MGISRPSYLDNDSNRIISGKLIKSIEDIREKQGDISWDITTPLQYLMVTGATTKSNLLNYTNNEKANLQSFRTAPEQYSIKTPDGVMTLGDYAKTKLGLPDISPTYINWSQSNLVTLTDTDRKYGQKYGISLSLTPKGREAIKGGWFSDGDESYNNTNSIKLVGVNTTKNVKEEQNRIQNMLLNTYKDIQDNNSLHDTNIAKQMGVVYFNNSNEGQAFDNLNLYTLPAGESKDINIRGNNYKIFSTIKDADKSDLMNVNFHLSQIVNGTEMVLARNNKTNITSWMPLSTANNSNEINKVTFETPNDIKAVIGSTIMDADFKANKSKAVENRNVYSEFMQSSSYIQPNDKTIRSTSYTKEVRTVRSNYNNPEIINLTNNVTGKVAKFESRVPISDLVNISINNKNNVAETVQYPYVNKAIAPIVSNLLKQENVTMTGGFRGESTHEGLTDSSDNSLHKYGFSVDIRKDEAGIRFLNKVKDNQSLLEQYGIINIMEHGVNPHIHIEFKQNQI